MLEECLIEVVEKYRYLYDRNSLLYNNRAKRKLAWQEISDKLKTPVRQCELRWRNLRDRFVKEYTRSLQCDTGVYDDIKWKHFDSLQFLVQHLKLQGPRKCQKSKCSVKSKNDDDATQSEVEGGTEICDSPKIKKIGETEFNEFDAELVKEVQNHAELYDKTHIYYFDKRAKARTWLKIANTLSCSGNEAKTRWRVLRDHFVRAYTTNKSLKTYNESRETPVIWELYDEMLFLQDYINPNIICSGDTETVNTSDEEDTFEESALKVPSLFKIHLINEVHKHECLLSCNVGSKIKRIAAWKRISAKLKMPAIVLQKKWRSLRDRFVKEYAKNPNTSKWRYYDDLKFLIVYINKNKTEDKSVILAVNNDEENFGFEEEAMLMDISYEATQSIALDTTETTKDQFDVNLIKEVKKFEEIYVTTNVFYRNTRRLACIWQTISEKLNKSAQRCRFRWHYLRDRFIKEQVYYEKFGKMDETCWHLYDDLLFLKDYVNNRRKILFSDIDSDAQQNADNDELPSTSFNAEHKNDLISMWDRIDCKQLIEEIKKRPILYKLQYSSFKYRKERSTAWNEITEQMKCSTEHCQVKWRGLRKRYRKECIKMEELKEINEEPITDWPYFNQMRFLTEEQENSHKSNDIIMIEDAHEVDIRDYCSDSKDNDIIEDCTEEELNYFAENEVGIRQQSSNDQKDVSIVHDKQAATTLNIDFDSFVEEIIVLDQGITSEQAVDNIMNEDHNAINQSFVEDAILFDQENAAEQTVDSIVYEEPVITDNEITHSDIIVTDDQQCQISQKYANNQQHVPFLQMVSQKLAQLPFEKQEDAKMLFLNYLHTKIKKSSTRKVSN